LDKTPPEGDSGSSSLQETRKRVAAALKSTVKKRKWLLIINLDLIVKKYHPGEDKKLIKGRGGKGEIVKLKLLNACFKEVILVFNTLA
jgi:hypothetical protein